MSDASGDRRRRRRSGRARGQPRADARPACHTWSSSGAGSARPGAGAGTASASSRPNWSVQLPGHPYDGDDPDGFMPRDEIVGLPGALRGGASTRRCARASRSPRSAATRRRASLLETSDGEHRGPERGPQHRRVPAAAPPAGRGDAPARPAPDRRRGLPQPGRAARRRGARGGQRPVGLPDRRGAPPRRPRRLPRLRPRGLGAAADQRPRHSSGGCERPAASTTASRTCRSPARRLWGNVQATGHDGGHDLHYRTLHAMGVTLLGHFLGADGHDALFAPTSTRASPGATSVTRRSWATSASTPLAAGLPWTDLDPPEPVDAEPPERIPLSGLGAVVFAGGFRPDYASWVDFPGAFDELGFPDPPGRRQHRRSRGCTSWACTSCASGSPRS